MRVDNNFYINSAEALAPALVGKLICLRGEDGEVKRMRIIETECYLGESDTACHASKGKTPRNSALWLAGGHSYVYLCYGMHALLNLTTGVEGHPEAVLIRGVAEISGPGRVTRAMQIDLSLNKMPLVPESGLWVEDDGVVPDFITTPRIGIDYASDECRLIPWRFVDKSA